MDDSTCTDIAMEINTILFECQFWTGPINNFQKSKFFNSHALGLLTTGGQCENRS